MRNLVVLGILALAAQQASAELLFDGFDYPAGNLTTPTTPQVNPYGPTWFGTGTTTVNPTVGSPGLTLPSTIASEGTTATTASGVTLNPAGDASRIGIGPFGLYQNTTDTSQPDQTVYFSLNLTLNNIGGLPTAIGSGALIGGFNNGVGAITTGTVGILGTRLWVGRADDANGMPISGKIWIGVSKTATAIVWDTNNYSTSTPLFIAGSYTIHGTTAGADDTSQIWVDPVSAPNPNYGALMPPTPTAQTASGTDIQNGQIESFVLFAQGRSSNTNNYVTVDNLRVSTTWAGVTPLVGTTWTTPTGSWGDASNWSNTTVPDGVSTFVSLTGTSAAAVTMEASHTAGTLTITNPAGYTVSGPGTLTLSGSSSINVTSTGTQTISAPLALAGDTEITIATGGTLTTTNLSAVAGATIRKAGSGTLQVAALRADNVIMDGGTIQVTPNGGLAGTSVVKTLTMPSDVIVGSGTDVNGTIIHPLGTLDLTNNALVVDYTGTSSLKTNTIETSGDHPGILNLILHSYNAGTWNGAGITTSLASVANDPNRVHALGYAESSDLLGASGGTFQGQSVDGSAILVLPTVYGDVNLNGKIDADDYALLDRGYAKYQSGSIATGTARWLDGDFNYDGIVDQNDYTLIDRAFYFTVGSFSPGFLEMRESEFGSTYVSSLLASVPEPSVIGLVGLLLPLVRRRHGR